jgi:hypothetical protein
MDDYWIAAGVGILYLACVIVYHRLDTGHWTFFEGDE